MTKAGEILANRLKSVIGESNLRGAPMRIEKAAATRGLIVTHSTLQRMLNGEGAHLEKIEDVAAYFGIEAWRLLCTEEPATKGLSISDAIDALASRLDQLGPEARETAAQHLQTLARAPDSKKARDALLAAIQTSETAPTAKQLMSMQATVESHSFQTTKNHE